MCFFFQKWHNYVSNVYSNQKRGKPYEKRIWLGFEIFEMNYLCQAKCNLLNCGFSSSKAINWFVAFSYRHTFFVDCK